jgi:hypothetical protein
MVLPPFSRVPIWRISTVASYANYRQSETGARKLSGDGPIVAPGKEFDPSLWYK